MNDHKHETKPDEANFERPNEWRGFRPEPPRPSIFDRGPGKPIARGTGFVPALPDGYNDDDPPRAA